MSTPAADVWLTGGTVFDATGREPFRADLRVSAGRVAEVVALDPTARPADRRGPGVVVEDVTGTTVLPGLVDAHAHVGILRLHGQAALPAPVQAAMVFAVLADSLAQGFTTLRDLGGVDGGLVEAVRRGLVPGPRLLPSGQILSQTGGHGDFRGPTPGGADPFQNPSTGADGFTLPMLLVDGPDAATRAARAQFHRGATQIKVFATGGLLSHGDPIEAPQLSEAELRAVVEVATDRGSYVTAHAHSPRGLQRAVRAGARCIEHATLVDEETVELMAAHDVAAVGTLTVSEVLRVDPASLGAGPVDAGDSARLRESAARAIDALERAGVRLGCGSDLIGERQHRRGWEVALHARLSGASVALQRATRVNAEICGIADEVGTLEVGKVADVAVFDGDVLAHPDLLMTTRPRLVLAGGAVVARTPRDHRDTEEAS